MIDLVWPLFDGYKVEKPAPDASDLGQAEDDEYGESQATYGRPKCSSCGDPNFSLADDRCISCRIGFG